MDPKLHQTFASMIIDTSRTSAAPPRTLVATPGLPAAPIGLDGARAPQPAAVMGNMLSMDGATSFSAAASASTSSAAASGRFSQYYDATAPALSSQSALLLGMAFVNESSANEKMESSRGDSVPSVVRDRARAMAMERAGFSVITLSKDLDEKYSEPGKHCNAFFSARSAKDVLAKRSAFTHVFFDWFRFPPGYSEILAGAFAGIMRKFVECGAISVGAQIFYPNLLSPTAANDFDKKVKEFKKVLSLHGFQAAHEAIAADLNPLYTSTQAAERKDPLVFGSVNCASEHRNLNSAAPFFRLTIELVVQQQPPAYVFPDSDSLPMITPWERDTAAELFQSPAARAEAFTAQLDRLALQTRQMQTAISASPRVYEGVRDTYDPIQERCWDEVCRLDLSPHLLGAVGVLLRHDYEKGQITSFGRYCGWYFPQRAQVESISEAIIFNTTVQLKGRFFVGRPNAFGPTLNCANNLPGGVRNTVRFYVDCVGTDNFEEVYECNVKPKYLDAAPAYRRNEEIFAAYGSPFFSHEKMACDVCFLRNPRDGSARNRGSDDAAEVEPCSLCSRRYVHRTCKREEEWKCAWCCSLWKFNRSQQQAPITAAISTFAPASVLVSPLPMALMSARAVGPSFPLAPAPAAFPAPSLPLAPAPAAFPAPSLPLAPAPAAFPAPSLPLAPAPAAFPAPSLPLAPLRLRPRFRRHRFLLLRLRPRFRRHRFLLLRLRPRFRRHRFLLLRLRPRFRRHRFLLLRLRPRFRRHRFLLLRLRPRFRRHRFLLLRLRPRFRRHRFLLLRLRPRSRRLRPSISMILMTMLSTCRWTVLLRFGVTRRFLMPALRMNIRRAIASISVQVLNQGRIFLAQILVFCSRTTLRVPLQSPSVRESAGKR